MSGWRAIVPVKLGRDGKTRLAARLAASERERLVETMAAHVVAQLAAAATIIETLILSPSPPPFPRVNWLLDRGRGLNPELAAALDGERVVVIHADLPLLSADDVDRLVAAARVHGAAIAPDRAGAGTNALALHTADGFRPRFGEDSFARHRAALPGAAVVERPGLACDVDTLEDYDRVFALASTAPGLRG